MAGFLDLLDGEGAVALRLGGHVRPAARRSKCRPDDPSLTERFELFVAGMEIANGFSELNDPVDQERRFRAQVAKGGQEAPKEVDTDYIRALAMGFPRRPEKESGSTAW